MHVRTPALTRLLQVAKLETLYRVLSSCAAQPAAEQSRHLQLCMHRNFRPPQSLGGAQQEGGEGEATAVDDAWRLAQSIALPFEAELGPMIRLQVRALCAVLQYDRQPQAQQCQQSAGRSRLAACRCAR